MHGGHMAATDSPTALRILWDVNVGLSTRYSCYPHTTVARLQGGSFAAQAKALHLGQPPQSGGTPVRSTGIGIPAPGRRGRQLAATDSPNAARHSWGPYASPSTWYWYPGVLQWLSQVRVLPIAQDDRDPNALQAPSPALPAVPFTNIIPTAAASASDAPITNAAGAPARSHIQPNSSDAGSAPRPIARLYHPNAVPPPSAITKSALSARSLPSVRPKKIPYTPNSAHSL